MKKIPTLFVRDELDRRYVTREVTPGCEWVLAGEGDATRKYDGTCVMFDGARWWSRREVKPGKNAPPNWLAADLDQLTGKATGWEPVQQGGIALHHADALRWANTEAIAERWYFDRGNGAREWATGTYELVGPKINGNPDGFAVHTLIYHGDDHLVAAPRDYDGLAEWLPTVPFEGVVFWHRNGDRCKIKRKDFPS